MAQPSAQTQSRLDRFGIVLSGACVVHCVLGLIVVAGLGLGGGLLLAPEIHHVGLVLAALVAAAAIGFGAIRHRRSGPLAVALAGLGFMGAALVVGHGAEEVVLTIIGVTMVAVGHFLNLRGPATHNLPDA